MTVDPDLTRWLLDRLMCALQPLTRDELANDLRYYEAACKKPMWTRETAARRLRELFSALEADGHLVVSTGHGFYIGTSEEDRQKAARRLEKQGMALLARAARIRRIPLREEMRQLELFGEEES